MLVAKMACLAIFKQQSAIQAQHLEYMIYIKNGVYKLLTMMAGWGLNVPSGKRKLTSTMSL